MLIKLKNPLAQEITNLNQIPDEAQIEQITLMWNQ